MQPRPLRLALAAAVVALPALGALALRADPADPRPAVQVRREGGGPRLSVHGIGLGSPRAEVIARHGLGFAGFFGEDDGAAPIFTRGRLDGDVICDRFFVFEAGRVKLMKLAYEAPPGRLRDLRAWWLEALAGLERRGDGDAVELWAAEGPVARIALTAERGGTLDVEVLR